LLKNNEIPASAAGQKSPLASKKSKLVGIFSPLPAPLAGESHDVFILPVRKGKDMNVATVRQVVLDPPHIGLELFLAVAKSSIDRKLAFLKTLVEKELAKFGGGLALGSCRDRQVEHNEDPHEAIPA
jgi:hypothetical protein